MLTVDEHTAVYISISRYDKNDVLDAGTPIVIKHFDRINGTQIGNTTNNLFPANPFEFQVVKSFLVIQHTDRPSEVHDIEMTIAYGANDQLIVVFPFRLINLSYVS